MTCKERVTAALRHQQPDVCPWSLGFTQPAAEKLAAYWGVADPYSRVGNHIAGFAAVRPDYWTEVSPDHWRDEWGAVWDRTMDKDIGNVVNRMLPEPTLEGYEWPDPDDPQRWAHVPASLESHPDEFVMVDLGFSLFERAWILRGMASLLMDMVEHPAFVDELLDRICDYNVAIATRAARYGIDCVHFGDDWGQQRGMIMGPRLWRRFLKPRLERQYAAVKAAGKFVSIHCCGDIQEVLPDLIEIGLDCFNPFQPEVIDVFAAKREFGDRLSFFGGVSTQHLLPYGTPTEVKEQAKRLMAEVGKDGGYIIAPAHAIPGDAPAENMAALIEAVNEQ